MRHRILGLPLLFFFAQAALALDSREPWVQPHDSREAMTNSDEYAWRVFVALNWPADLGTRRASPSATFGSDRPVVWESWKNAADVFLEGGRKPLAWAAPNSGPAADETRFESGSLKDLPNARHIVQGRMVPLTDPLASAKRLTEIRLNEVSYDYIRARGLYSEEGQLQAVAEREGVHFPPGSTDIKAKWRPIAEADRSRYHTLLVTLSDGTRRLYGLTALHIATKDLEHWFWATFEHVDNQTSGEGEGWQLPSHDAFACRGKGADCNDAPSGVGLENTVWANYRLRGTLGRFVDGENRPLLLANSELEAGMQTSSSCIACHARSSIGVVAGQTTRLPIFQPAEIGSMARRGYVGAPQAEWFGPSESGAQPLFQQLDFVWSLAKARPRSGS
jgi:hypothetical protein